jgi:Holliday junction resolvasome RuvABC endonuclease subunit
MILGIDVGEMVGVANSQGASACWNLRNLANTQHEGAMHLALQIKLDKIIGGKKKGYTHVAIEIANFSMTTNGFTEAAKVSELIGIVIGCAAKHKVKLIRLAPSAVRMMATGKGNSTRKDLLSAAISGGVELKNEHIATAYWVVCTARQLLNR